MFIKAREYIRTKYYKKHLVSDKYIMDISISNTDANHSADGGSSGEILFKGSEKIIRSAEKQAEKIAYKKGQIIEYDNLQYRILSVDDTTVEVANNQEQEGLIKIPNKICNGSMWFDVISIGDSAFARSAITSITLPTTPYTIKNFAFLQTSMLKEAWLNAATNIGCAAFRNSGIEVIHMPECQYETEFQSFWGTNLRSIDFQNATKFGTELLGYSKVEEVILPKTEYEISYKMFSETFELKHLDISHAKTIGKQAFLVTYGLTLFLNNDTMPSVECFSFLAAENVTIIYPDTPNFDKFSKSIDNGWGACTKKVRYNDFLYRNVNAVEGEAIKIGFIFDLVLEEEQIQFQWYKDGVAIKGAHASVLTIAEATESFVGEYELEVIIPNTGSRHNMGVRTIKVRSKD